MFTFADLRLKLISMKSLVYNQLSVFFLPELLAYYFIDRCLPSCQPGEK